MKVGIDISPLSSGHKVRGVGSYVSMLKENIERHDKKNKYIFFEKDIPENIDLLHIPYFDPFSLVLPFRKKVKTVVTIHDLIPLSHEKNFPVGFKANLKWQINKRLLKNVDKIVVDSEASKKAVVNLTGVNSKKVEVVYLGVSPDFKKLDSEYSIQGTRKKFSLPENFFLYVGDATWNKNLPRIIESVKKSDRKLVMVGKVWEKDLENVPDHPWNKDLRSVLNEIKDDDRFIKLGFVSSEDIVKIYNLATALLMPSLDEGFGLPVLEAMSCGCPVITSREGSLPEVGGDAVKYVDAKSYKSISESINEFKNDKRKRYELSKKGLDRAKEFTIKKSLEDLIAVYESVYKKS